MKLAFSVSALPAADKRAGNAGIEISRILRLIGQSSEAIAFADRGEQRLKAFRKKRVEQRAKDRTFVAQRREERLKWLSLTRFDDAATAALARREIMEHDRQNRVTARQRAHELKAERRLLIQIEQLLGLLKSAVRKVAATPRGILPMPRTPHRGARRECGHRVLHSSGGDGDDDGGDDNLVLHTRALSDADRAFFTSTVRA